MAAVSESKSEFHDFICRVRKIVEAFDRARAASTASCGLARGCDAGHRIAATFARRG
jgi:hypothetical protein